MPPPDLPVDPAQAAQHRALVEELLEGSPAAAFLLDSEFRVAWFNAAMERVLGDSREHLLDDGEHDRTRELLAGICVDGGALEGRLLTQYRAGEPEKDIECHILAGEGREERWLARHSRLIGEGYPHACWVEFYVDISDRKRAEQTAERLAESSEEQAFILGNMHGFTYRHDLDGVFHYMSPSVQRITGYRVEDWMNHYTTYLTDNPVNEDVVLKTEGTLASGKSNEPYLVEVYHRDGSRVLLEVAERAYFEGGEVAGVVGVALDVTERNRAEGERRHLEGRLQHAQKLESLGVLAGGIAHDFNNLLTAVLGNATLALDEVPSDSQAREHLTDIVSAAQRAADLCGQMLAYSGRGAFASRPIDLSQTVGEMAAVLEVSISKKIELSLDFARDLPAVEGDPSQIQQVALNLITNASESIGDAPGQIHIRTGFGEYDVKTLRRFVAGPDPVPGTYVWLEVQDSGLGMSRATVERIFDPFYSTKFAGRGLGLSTVLGIMRGHEGALEIESTLGKGTRFRAYFPAGIRPAAPSPPPRPLTAPRSGLVLLVDDELAVRKVGAAMLEKLGYEALLACDGEEGLALFEQRHAEILAVVLDVTMPKMGGDECLMDIRALEPTMPVILASGYDEAEVTRKLDRSVSFGFLCKPYTLEALADELRKVTGNA